MNETIAMVNEVPLRDEVYYRMLSTDIDQVGDLRDIIIVTHHHHHSSVSYASMPVSDIKPPKTTSNRDHIRCKEMSVVNHDGYQPSNIVHASSLSGAL